MVDIKAQKNLPMRYYRTGKFKEWGRKSKPACLGPRE
jgi:hypothetical protein